jgi:hypothetical protein
VFEERDEEGVAGFVVVGGGTGGREVEAEFLGEFAEGGVVVVFAGVDVAGAGGGPAVGEGVLGGGAALEVDFAAGVEDEDVDGAVEEAAAVNFGAGFLVEDVVVLVDDVKDIGGGMGHGEERKLRNMKAKGKMEDGDFAGIISKGMRGHG